MRRVVVDASALGALVFQEPEADDVAERLGDAVVFAPTLLKFELANTAVKKLRRDSGRAATYLAALAVGLDAKTQITWLDVNVTDVALLASATGLSAYDASYLWLAGSLGADLVTLDERLVRAGAALA
jgi:predicted nucleic acid-binding protein